ncbi:MAG: zinc-ribbon domain containing protein [Patescibacteria group bacterium]
MSNIKACKNCSQNFEVSEDDQDFYKKIQVSEPTLCPKCRHQRRIAFRNERNLFKRGCDLCKKSIISFYDVDAPFPVYCSDCWWTDKWNPLDYGQDFDFDKSFFAQYQELMLKVPKTGMLNLDNENSDYNSLVAFSKNTYMSPGSYCMEDCYYSRKSQYCKNCLNSNFIDHCELCVFCINCNNCYQCAGLVNCRNCTDCYYLENCSSCQNCFMCSDVANRKFCYKNQQYGESEYAKILEVNLKKSREELRKEFKDFVSTIPKKYQNQINCENSSGDYLQNCKSAVDCYDCFSLEDCRFLDECVDVKDSMDLSMHDKGVQLCYELISGGDNTYNVNFSFCTCSSQNCSYTFSCFNIQDCFGCDSIHQKVKYCILNKQYSQEQYEELLPKILQHMRSGQEWGEMLPISLSPHAYNMTLANDYYPLTEEQAKAKGYSWKTRNPANYKPATKDILACKVCAKNYQVIPQELDLSRKLNQPISEYCSDCRQLELMSFKNPRHLYVRNCMKCGESIKSTYSPDRKETVYCVKCYLAEVY